VPAACSPETEAVVEGFERIDADEDDWSCLVGQQRPDNQAADPLSLPFREHGYGSKLARAVAILLDLADTDNFLAILGDQEVLPMEVKRIEPGMSAGTAARSVMGTLGSSYIAID
jgi:hypothetical protein